MNRPEVKLTFEEWAEVLRIAATIWPQSRSFFDDRPDAERTPTRTWWAALCGFEAQDVLTAVGRLGTTSRFWPSLADVVEATRDVLADRMAQRRKEEQYSRPRLAAPSQRTVGERLAAFDDTSAVVRRERREELQRFVWQANGGDIDAGRTVDRFDGVGCWELRLRELIARGWPDDEAGARDPSAP